MSRSGKDPAQLPTMRQGTVLQTLAPRGGMTAGSIGVRADVLWRMEERGWVARNMHEVWHILPDGRAALERWEKALGINLEARS